MSGYQDHLHERYFVKKLTLFKCGSLAYTMFNVYLPKLLEARSAAGAAPKTLEGTLWDVVIFTIGGCPGAVVSLVVILIAGLSVPLSNI